jgi:hypothetical protein
MVLTIYSRPGCHLCQDMTETAERVVKALGVAARIDEVSIAGEPELEARYGAEIPVLLVNGRKAAKYRVSEEALTRILTAGGAAQEGGGARRAGRPDRQERT